MQLIGLAVILAVSILLAPLVGHRLHDACRSRTERAMSQISPSPAGTSRDWPS